MRLILALFVFVATATMGAAADPMPAAIINGVNFSELTYANGPCEGEASHMHRGYNNFYSKAADRDLTASVENVFAGRIGTTRAAVVVLRCEYIHGYNAEARLYTIAAKTPKFVTTVGTFFLTGPDTPSVQGDWIHATFARDATVTTLPGLLFVDTWDDKNHCDPRHDWTASTYAMSAAGKISRIDQWRHHRKGVAAVSCS